MSKIDDLEHALLTAVAEVAAHEGSALGVGDSIDEIPEAVVGLRHASRHDFAERYAAVSKALHGNWTRRVGTPGYHKPLWMAIDNALSRYTREIATSIGFEGSWVPVDPPTRPARAGDHYRFTYPNEPQFDKTLLVERTLGDGPEDLVFFEDHSHSKQKHLNKPGAERVSL